MVTLEPRNSDWLYLNQNLRLVGVVSRNVASLGLVPLQHSELVALRIVLGQLALVALNPELEVVVPAVEAVPVAVPDRLLRLDLCHPVLLITPQCKLIYERVDEFHFLTFCPSWTLFEISPLITILIQVG